MLRILDASHFQTVTDWKKLSKAVDAVILKATEGIGYVDATFQDKRTKARKAGMLVGSYHFSDGGDALQEATHYLSTVGEMLEGEFLCLDYEIHLQDPVTWCKTFLDECYRRSGIRPLIYLNSSTASTFNWQKVSKDYGLWIASYGVNDGLPHNTPRIGLFPNYVLWQYTSTGKVDGISGNVDLSLGNITLATLKKYGKVIPVPTPKAEQPKIEAPAVPEVKSDIQTPPTPTETIVPPVYSVTGRLLEPTTIINDGEPIIQTDPNIQAMNQAEQDLTPFWEAVYNFFYKLFNIK